jgi:hypothetical protein
MTLGAFDYAVFGASPFALLLAGQLKSAHGKRVALVADGWSPYRLPRGFDLSVIPATRPETWAQLKAGAAETLKLLGGIGKGLYERVDPLFVAETGASADYLGHMRWVALGLGFAAERASDRAITAEGTICRVRDAATLVGGRIEPALEAWLDRLEVPRLSTAGITLNFPRTGAALLSRGEDALEAETVILADDEAILGRLAEADRHRLLTVTPRTSLLTEPAKALTATLVHYLDRDVALLQRGGKGPVAAIASGDADLALPRVASTLTALGPLRRSGQTVFRSVGTADRAPLIGRMGKGKAIVVAGLGDSAAFQAPAVARLLTGSASESEKQYFEPRETQKAANRQSVAEAAVPEMVP